MISDVEFARISWLQWLCWVTGLTTLWRNRPVLVSWHRWREADRADNYRRLMWKARYELADSWEKMLEVSRRDDCPPEIRKELEDVAESMGWMRPDPDWVPVKAKRLFGLCVARSIIGPNPKLDCEIQREQDALTRHTTENGGDFVISNMYWTNLVKQWGSEEWQWEMLQKSHEKRRVG